MMSEALAGRGVLVTGASSGIGRAIALGVARAGADVALTYRSNRAGADAVAREIEALGRTACVQALDLADEPSIDSVTHQSVPSWNNSLPVAGQTARAGRPAGPVAGGGSSPGGGPSSAGAPRASTATNTADQQPPAEPLSASRQGATESALELGPRASAARITLQCSALQLLSPIFTGPLQCSAPQLLSPIFPETCGRGLQTFLRSRLGPSARRPPGRRRQYSRIPRP